MIPNSDQIEFFMQDDSPIEYSNEDDDYMNTNVINVKSYKFSNVNLRKNDWNKIHLSVYPHNVSLFINCQKSGEYQLKNKPTVDGSGEVWFVKSDDDYTTVPVSKI